MEQKESYHDMFMKYVNTKDHLCEVEDVIVEEKRSLFNLFKKENIFHNNYLGSKFIRIDIYKKQVLSSELMVDCGNTSRMWEIQDAIDHNTYPWQLLFSYDETHLNNDDGIVDFMDNKKCQCLASFFLDDAELHVMTPKGWVSYKIEKRISENTETQESQFNEMKDETPTKSNIKNEIYRTNPKKHLTDDEIGVVVENYLLSHNEIIKKISYITNEDFRNLLNDIAQQGVNQIDTNKIARNIIKKARELSKNRLI